jgi:hypothetical protein
MADPELTDDAFNDRGGCHASSAPLSSAPLSSATVKFGSLAGDT